MPDTTIFDSPDQGQEPEVQPTQQAAEPQAFSDLVGEGKKYATVEAAMASIPHAQTHISKLEQELAQLREEVNKRNTTQQLLDEFKSKMQPSGTTNPKEVSQDEIVKLVEQVVTQTKVKEQAELNSKLVVNKFVELFGQDKAKEQFKKLSQETGLPLSELNALASKSPSALFKLAGIGTSQTNTPAKTSSDYHPGSSAPASPIKANVTGNSSKDLLDAWRRAGEKVRQNLGS